MLDKLLSVLSDGAFHSGSELGRELGISRSAVWKHMQRLQELGLEVYSVKGRGYRLPGGLDLIDGERLREQLRLDEQDERLAVVEVAIETESTNSQGTQALQQGIPGGLFVAEYQHAGRGRRGRQWLSPLASSLCFTLAWRFNTGVAALEGLSLAVGLALQQALVELGIDQAGVKWPNDLLVGQAKLAGILIEISGDAAGECQVAIGVGLNVALPERLAEALDQPCVDLRTLGFTGDRTELLGALVLRLVRVLQDFENGGFARLRSAWEAVHVFQGQSVRLTSGAHTFEGVCLGVTDQGGIRLQTDQGTEVFHGGEVSVRAYETA
ncbi:bifunctional biotin--[acetyl-CoA-carboxylase] ligase/biotin operon repressor BirA [Marinobacterium marinum]|uniref:Bifunctional ligase/repressor BirA n=1 Tax=Marinobacterium marinum TaxID=2756129 RepID=A0A7W1WWN5_9GAMM|nr:bifunctional biotin--[acetyl-CoA-carboxylase] ligase/biotin operon repressor BirA [Marinobacterium marinum]MBA4501603.1 bifunctional biotin--[acetyl-CoA-carboxylase] ligase/biotin operon repressor BirA [Marinobacterium marinum]